MIRLGIEYSPNHARRQPKRWFGTCRRLDLSLALIGIGTLFGVISADASGRPEIHAPEPVFNFGSVPATHTVEHAFVIQNVGDETLEVGKIRACCGGTADIATKSILPGSSTVLRATLSLMGRTGHQSNSAYVASNDPETEWLQLRIEGTVAPEVEIEPSVAEFGAIMRDARADIPIDLRFHTKRYGVVTGAISSSSRFVASVTPISNGTYQMSIQTVPPMPDGKSDGTITLLTDGSNTPTFSIYAHATSASDVLMVPNEIPVLDNGSSPKPITRYVALKSKSGRAFEVLTITAPESGMTTGIQKLGPGSYRLEIGNILPFSDLNGESILITTDHPDEAEMRVPFRVVSGSQVQPDK